MYIVRNYKIAIENIVVSVKYLVSQTRLSQFIEWSTFQSDETWNWNFRITWLVPDDLLLFPGAVNSVLKVLFLPDVARAGRWRACWCMQQAV